MKQKWSVNVYHNIFLFISKYTGELSFSPLGTDDRNYVFWLDERLDVAFDLNQKWMRFQYLFDSQIKALQN